MTGGEAEEQEERLFEKSTLSAALTLTALFGVGICAAVAAADRSTPSSTGSHAFHLQSILYATGQLPNKPYGEAAGASFGTAIAISDDGNTLLVGAPDDNGERGAAWIFFRSGSEWVQQAKLTPRVEGPNAKFGGSVALSGNGDVAVVGAAADDHFNGSVSFFVRSRSKWQQVGPRLIPQGRLAPLAFQFGSAVALSEDGRTAIATNVPEPNGGAPLAVWILAQSSLTHRWSTRTVIRTHVPYNALDTGSASLSASGRVALVSFTEEAIRLDDSHSKWTAQTEVTASRGATIDTASLSADGRRELFGAIDANSDSLGYLVDQRGKAKLLPAGADTGSGGIATLSANGNVALVAGSVDGGRSVAVRGFYHVHRGWRTGAPITNANSFKGSDVQQIGALALSADGHTAAITATATSPFYVIGALNDVLSNKFNKVGKDLRRTYVWILTTG